MQDNDQRTSEDGGETALRQPEPNRRQFAALGVAAIGGAIINDEGFAAEPGVASKPAPAGAAAGTGPWESAISQLRQWDPMWAAACEKMSRNPWEGGVLSRKLVELISLALNASCTNLNAEGTRRHIRAVLDAGATRNEILLVIRMASVVSIHSCSLGAPILLEEAKTAGIQPASRKAPVTTPACDKMREIGQWNQAWDPFFELDSRWTDEFMALAAGIYGSGVFSPKEIEFFSIALDATVTHMYAPGTRRHIKAALKLGATMEEVMEVLKICVSQGVQSCNLAIPILGDELAKRSR